MNTRPVRPRHAASLVLTRKRGTQLQVLMGKRPAKAVFPAAYVFPGGRLDHADKAIVPSASLQAQTLEQLCTRGGCTPILAQALATTAIRETFEETGLFVAASGSPGTSMGAWNEFTVRGLAPAHDKLSFLGRAITPASAPVRFHARFFLASGDDVTGTLTSNGELLELDWYDVEHAKTLPAVDVTKFVLNELASVMEDQGRQTPFFRYRRNRPVGGVNDK